MSITIFYKVYISLTFGCSITFLLVKKIFNYKNTILYPDREMPSLLIGPTVDVLKAFCWKIWCPPKLKHFLWQLVTGCIVVKKNLQARRIQGDICCGRCGAQEESINHVVFECPPTIQVWPLSKITSNPAIFTPSSLFTNMDHLY